MEPKHMHMNHSMKMNMGNNMDMSKMDDMEMPGMKMYFYFGFENIQMILKVNNR